MPINTFKNINGKMCQGTGLFSMDGDEILLGDKVRLHTGHGIYDGVIVWDPFYARFKIEGDYPMALDGSTSSSVEIVRNTNGGRR